MTTTEEKITIMQAFVDGKQIEIFSLSLKIWVASSNPAWDWLNTQYRIKVTKPSIDWSHVADRFNYLSRDKIGGYILSTMKPTGRHIDGHFMGRGECLDASVFSSLDPGTCDWKDSLICRSDSDD